MQFGYCNEAFSRKVARIVTSVAMGCVVCIVAGCANARVDVTPRTGEIRSMNAAEVDARADAVRVDPLAYIHRVAERCGELRQYTLRFTRIERRGLLFKSLRRPEQIACWFRREPFSIRMKWLDPDVKYGESTYVAGRENDKVRFVPRHGLFGLPPGLIKVGLRTPVVWGEATRPLTEWGLEKLMLETLDSIGEMEAKGGVVIDYRGVVMLPERERPLHLLYMEYPREPGVSSIQELYIDVETDIPAGTVLRYRDGRLFAAYFYDDLDTDVSLTDDDFVLDIERRAE